MSNLDLFTPAKDERKKAMELDEGYRRRKNSNALSQQSV
jgi:hypothetical protein